ncbi:aminoglycoside phosphotransferase family protein [Actinomycetospora sp. NBRC 106378]|uniref:aminoglycoside phosphotransferase family protein n=1 Tax=Actinomycetospora sp. NBRC 106378 TaxID=3032208 RepID=UPI0024A31296|nr:aminoglycoside phosphotransferase family protein [Actinomycetospora sp. NBRC 106378]GLZ54274.1 aminoglycoside O-phosphotransferase [Actinomycetospora sp. NBRC 106378]
MIEVPAEARRRMARRHGDDVEAWLDGVPALVARLARRWRVTPDGAVLSGNSGLVVPADRGVLKLTPDVMIAATEAAALQYWAPCRHVVNLLDHDDGALLLGRVRPGTALPSETGALDVVPALRDLMTAEGPLPDLPPLGARIAFWLGRVREQVVDEALDDRIPLGRLDDAAHRAAALGAERGHHGVVHGDLHPANLLAGPDGAVVIDPRPHLGDRTFDLVDLVLLDPDALDGTVEGLARELDGVDPDRLHAWCHALAPANAVAALRTAPDAPHTAALVRLAQRSG